MLQRNELLFAQLIIVLHEFVRLVEKAYSIVQIDSNARAGLNDQGFQNMGVYTGC
jgi:hypothetical protein